MMELLIKRPDGDFRVLLLRHKGTSFWSFVNLTKGHICPCKFKSVGDAMADLNNYIRKGKVLSYKIVTCHRVENETKTGAVCAKSDKGMAF